NAGVGVFGPIADATHNDWVYTMRVDFWGVVHGIEAFLPRLLAQQEPSHIVNTASMAGLVGMEWLGVYCAAKFAVGGLTEALYREVGGGGGGASALSPMIGEATLKEPAARHRPAAPRTPGAPAPEGAPAPPMAGATITVEEVARRVVRAIERNDFYI